MWNCTRNIIQMGTKRTSLPLQVNLPLLSCSLGIRLFLFWYLATDWFGRDCWGGILRGCCPLSAPPTSTPRWSRDLFVFISCRRRVFWGPASARFVRGRLWCCNRVWGHTVFCSIGRCGVPLSPTRLIRRCCFFLKRKSKMERNM